MHIWTEGMIVSSPNLYGLILHNESYVMLNIVSKLKSYNIILWHYKFKHKLTTLDFDSITKLI